MPRANFEEKFKSPFRSIGRSKKHIQDFAICITEFNQSNPSKQVRKYSKDRSQYLVVSRLVRPLPEDLECIATDAIYNLRSTLDQVIHVAATISEPYSTNFNIDYDWFSFPIKQQKEDVEKWINKHCKKGFHQFFGDVILELEPWEHDNKESLLYWLNKAANVNKHKFLTAVQLRSGVFSGKHISGPKTLLGPNIEEFSIGGPKSNISITHPTIKAAGDELALYCGYTRYNTKYEINVEVDVQFKNIHCKEKYSCVARLNDIVDECENIINLFIKCAERISKQS